MEKSGPKKKYLKIDKSQTLQVLFSFLQIICGNKEFVLKQIP